MDQGNISSLLTELFVIASKDAFEDGGVPLVRRKHGELRHALLELGQSLGEGGEDGCRVSGSARDVVCRVVGIDDGDPVRIPVYESVYLALHYSQSGQHRVDMRTDGRENKEKRAVENIKSRN